ncbi:uncharacterized protein LOC124689152 [Lolium rigidum]|uniref:uncharacterized protein LOC124689152 n=1 Tax=Lolium rigidum TaxID=89674 RepID=UPI001F5E140D|nr:uncharacterized protein LOC124689152 [Lolium rigidum]
MGGVLLRAGLAAARPREGPGVEATRLAWRRDGEQREARTEALASTTGDHRRQWQKADGRMRSFDRTGPRARPNRRHGHAYLSSFSLSADGSNASRLRPPYASGLRPPYSTGGSHLMVLIQLASKGTIRIEGLLNSPWLLGTADGETKIRASEVGLAAVVMVATLQHGEKGHRHWGAKIFDLGQLDSLCRCTE